MTDTLILENLSKSSQILNAIKSVFDIKNDAQLADFLDVTRASIHTLRQPRRLIGKKIRLIVMQKIAFLEITNWGEKLTTQYLETKLIQSGFQSEEKQKITQEGAFLGLLKAFYKCETDIQLAKHLSLKPNTLSMFRVGRTTLGPLPLLKILCDLENLPYQVIRDVLQSDSMFEVVLQDFADKKQLGK